MKALKTALFLLPLVAALVLGVYYLSRRSGPAADQWDAMQRAVGGEGEPSPAAPQAAPPPASQRLARSDIPLNPPDAPPPGGPFAEDGRDSLPEAEGPGYDYLLLTWVEEHLAREDLDVVDLAGQFLASPIPSERTAGAVLLAALGVLDAETAVRLAGDDDPAVPVNVLGWLRDSGDEAGAEMLLEALAAEGHTVEALRDLVSEPALSAAGRRALIELVAGSGMDPAELSPWLAAAAASPLQPLEVRAKAAIALRGVAEPDDIVRHLAASRDPAAETKGDLADGGEGAPRARPGDRAWAELGERLARDLVAPPGLANVGDQVSLVDVEEWTASGSVAVQLLEVAGRLEFALRMPEARVEPGVADAVIDYLDQVESGQPLPPDLLLAVRRIRGRLPLLSAVEAASSDRDFTRDGPPR